MKFGDLDKWVGLSGMELRQRAKALGHIHSLKDQIDVQTANKLYKALPIEKKITVSYKDVRHPAVEFIGSWNLREWQRLLNKIQREILVRNRDFIKAAREGAKKPVEVEPEVQEQVEITEQDQSVSAADTVSNIDALVSADAESVKSILQEHDDARRDESASTGTPSRPHRADPGIDGADPRGSFDPGGRHPEADIGVVAEPVEAVGAVGS